MRPARHSRAPSRPVRPHGRAATGQNVDDTGRRRDRQLRALQPRWPDRLVESVLRRRRGGRRVRLIRRVCALALFAIAGALAMVQPRAAPGVAVLTLLRDLPSGTRLAASDVTTEREHAAPDGALTPADLVAGRLLAGPARRGEVLTDARLVPANGPAAGPGRVAVPVRPADPGTVNLLSPGAHVAVVGVGDNGAATLLAGDAVVLDLPPPMEHASDARRLVVLSVPTGVADRLAATGAAGTIALRFT